MSDTFRRHGHSFHTDLLFLPLSYLALADPVSLPRVTQAREALQRLTAEPRR